MSRSTGHTAQGGALAVRARGLVKDFSGLRAVDQVDLDVPQGAVFGVLGPNGAGKTTMLRMLATLLRIDHGSAEVFGVDVAGRPHAVRQLIGVTGQYASVDEALTARENLRLFARIHGQSGRSAAATAARLLERFGLEDAADRRLADFSGGMRRRLDLAASLIATPPLIFLDEPTTGLDPRTRGQMWDTIRDLVAAGSTILLTTQYLDEADQLADRIAVIDHGRKVAEGTSDELKASVGASTLEVRLSGPDDLGEAGRVMATVVGAEPRLFPQTARLGVSLPAADSAADVLIALRQSRISISEVSVLKPSLDEVFLALTGHPSGAAEAAPQDGGAQQRPQPRRDAEGVVEGDAEGDGERDIDPTRDSSKEALR